MSPGFENQIVKKMKRNTHQKKFKTAASKIPEVPMRMNGLVVVWQKCLENKQLIKRKGAVSDPLSLLSPSPLNQNKNKIDRNKNMQIFIWFLHQIYLSAFIILNLHVKTEFSNLTDLTDLNNQLNKYENVNLTWENQIHVNIIYKCTFLCSMFFLYFLFGCSIFRAATVLLSAQVLCPDATRI